MARTSQMLIALWDGTDNGKTGGTAQVVSFKLHDVPEIYAETLTTSSGSMRSHLDAVEVGPVYHIVTPRVSSAEVPDSPLTVTKRFRHIEHNSSDEASESSYDRTYANIDAFNADALLAETEPGLKAHVEQSKSYLIPEEELQTLPASLKSICQDFGVADALANHYKERTLQLLYLLFGIVFVAAVTLEIYSDIQDKMHLLLVFYPLLLGVAYIPWYFGLKQRKWQDRHQDYRALAEGLRVEFFWQLADLPTSVADHYLRKQKSELDWIRIAIRSADCIWNPPVGKVEHHGASAPVDPETIRRLELVEKRWVQDQCKYYARAAPRDQRESERIERWVKRLLASSPIFAFVWGILLLIPKIDAFVDDHKLHGFMMLSVVIPALVGASLHTYADKRALAQQAKQYKRMQVLFDTAARRMAEYMQHHRYTHAQELVKELGKEALAENGDWVLTHRERPVEVPQG